jgi:hypothetical protein
VPAMCLPQTSPLLISSTARRPLKSSSSSNDCRMQAKPIHEEKRRLAKAKSRVSTCSASSRLKAFGIGAITSRSIAAFHRAALMCRAAR